jgi:hypothetical protein
MHSRLWVQLIVMNLAIEYAQHASAKQCKTRARKDVNIVAIVAIVLRRMKSLLSSTIEPRRIK